MNHPPDKSHLHEKRETLWMLAASPTIWAGHFLLSYITAAIWCAKVATPLGPIRTAIAAYTVVALVGIGMITWWGLRQHRYGGTSLPHHFDFPEDRHRFMGFATLLLSGLSAVATIFVALTVLFIKTCH